MGIADERIIGGVARATKGQATAYLLAGPQRRVADAEVRELTDALWEFGTALGIAPDVAAAQIAHETGVLSFAGDVDPAQRNVAGIGTTGGGVKGLTFPNWRTGVAAYFIHLLAWCNRLDLAPRIAGEPPETLDPRVPLVAQVRATKGAATTWASLGGRWAVPGDSYAAGIERHHAAILAIAMWTEQGREPHGPNYGKQG